MEIKGKGDFYFKRSNGELVLLAENVSEEEAMVKMKEFLDLIYNLNKRLFFLLFRSIICYVKV